jgi:uncharacterized membrane protein
MNNNSRSRTLHLTQLAVLSAIIVIMAFTPLGYFKTPALSITFLTVPVVLGAILMGPLDGAILGAVFGATSFIQCFGLDAFGTTLLSINPVFTFIMCFVPRILIGLVSGYLLKGLEKIHTSKVVSYALSALAGALTNTVFFVGFLLLLFGQTDYIRSFGPSIPAIIGVLVTMNALIEAIVCTIIATILAAQDQGKKLNAYCSETRPYLQGARLTADAISELGVPTVVITDNMPGLVISQGKIDTFFAGTDRVTRSGHVFNKVGTFQIALCCNYYNVPCYAFAHGPDPNSYTEKDVMIEERDPEETLRCLGGRTATENRNVSGYYPAFDVTPPELFTGIITEKGIFKPENITDYFKISDGGNHE